MNENYQDIISNKASSEQLNSKDIFKLLMAHLQESNYLNKPVKSTKRYYNSVVFIYGNVPITSST